MGWSGPCFCPTNDGCCESAVLRALDVAFGSKPEVSMLPCRVCFTPTNRHSSARPGNAKPEDVHLASTIHCVDDEIIKWLQRRERCLCGHPGPDIRRFRVPLRTAGKYLGQATLWIEQQIDLEQT